MADLQATRAPPAPGPVAEVRRGLADISNFVVAQHREGAVIGYRYPAQFKDHIVEGADGERIAASIALQEAARPGLIVVHGALHLEPLRLRPPDRRPRVLRVGLQRRRARPAELRADRADSAGALDRGLEGEPRHPRPGRLHEGARLDQRRRPGDLPGRELRRSTRRSAPAPRTPSTAGSSRSRRPPTPSGPGSASPSRSRRPIRATRSTACFQAALVSRIRSGRWPAEAEDMAKVMERRRGAVLRGQRRGDLAQREMRGPRRGGEGPAAGAASGGRPDHQGRARARCCATPPPATTSSGSGSCPPELTARSRRSTPS